ncbi:hypothetical protein FRC00_006717, partial [Tulasnella sp. 408]
AQSKEKRPSSSWVIGVLEKQNVHFASSNKKLSFSKILNAGPKRDNASHEQ